MSSVRAPFVGMSARIAIRASLLETVTAVMSGPAGVSPARSRNTVVFESFDDAALPLETPP